MLFFRLECAHLVSQYQRVTKENLHSYGSYQPYLQHLLWTRHQCSFASHPGIWNLMFLKTEALRGAILAFVHREVTWAQTSFSSPLKILCFLLYYWPLKFSKRKRSHSTDDERSFASWKYTNHPIRNKWVLNNGRKLLNSGSKHEPFQLLS